MSTKRRAYGCRQEFSSSVCRRNVRKPLTTLSQNIETIERSSAGVNQQSNPEPLTSPLPRKNASASNERSEKKKSKTAQLHKLPREQLGKQGRAQRQGFTVKSKRRSTKIKTAEHSNDIFSRLEPNFDEGGADPSVFSSASPTEFDDRERKRLLQLQDHVRSEKNIDMPFNHQRPICFTPKSYAKWTATQPSCVKYSANSADDESVFKAIMNSSIGKRHENPHNISEKLNCKASVAPVNSLFTLVGSTIDLIHGKMDFTDTSEVTMNEHMFAPSCQHETRNRGDDGGLTCRHNCNYMESHELDNAPHNVPSYPPQGIDNTRVEGRSDVQQQWDKVTLPSGWKMKRASKTGRAYYVHAGYGSTWYHPLQPPPTSAKILLTEVPSALKRTTEESKCNTSLKSKRLFETEKQTTGKERTQESVESVLHSDLARPRKGYNLRTKLRKKVWHHRACSLQRLRYLNR
jgi:hypothetical protein